MKNLILFDVDGTLTASRQKITNEMTEVLEKLSKLDNLDIGFVGGSNLPKQHEQLGDSMKFLKYWFPENGIVAYENGVEFHKNSFIGSIGYDNYQELIDYFLKILSDIKLPKKTGLFVELRDGLLNLCPVGRLCSYDERIEFFEFDKVHNIRKNICKKLAEKFPEFNLSFVIGGQISIDVFPKGWDKTYCLKHVSDIYDKIYFFGDKYLEGGNDFEIYSSSRTDSFKVDSPEDTIRILKSKFLN